jgi:hypothetical protein
MKIIEVSRSFSAKIQIKQFEPIETFASYKAEVDEKDDLQKVSNDLYERAMNDVGMTISDAKWNKWLNPQKEVRKIVKSNAPF